MLSSHQIRTPGLSLRRPGTHNVRALPLPRRWLGSFKVGDSVLLRRNDGEGSPVFIKALKEQGEAQTHRGTFHHDTVLGQHPRAVITSSAGRKLRAHHPTLGEYVTLTRRRVTPIYPGEANLIVSLLDIHPQSRTDDANGQPLEILEAGTGHGSLTLHLARAVHAANVATTPDNRGAIVHSLDVNKAHSAHAAKVVAGFRHGMYVDDVEFYVSDIPSFIENEHERRKSTAAFLDYIMLDLPRAHDHLQIAADSTKADGIIAMFCPQVTQIIEGLHIIERLDLPLHLEQVVELGANISGGKKWEVKLVTPRGQKTRTDSLNTCEDDHENNGGPSLLSDDGDEDVLAAENQRTSPEGLVQVNADIVSKEAVCRPKYGEVVTAGGFLALWKRKH